MFILKLTNEEYNSETREFLDTEVATLHLEHSLVALSKWESKWHLPFIDTNKTPEQTISYIECCILDKDYDPEVLKYLSEKNFKDFNEYIQDPMTAKKIYTYGSTKSTRQNHSVVTAEDFYYSMIKFHIYKECETWHLQRLLSLIQVFSVRNDPNNKMSKKDLASFNREENARRRAKYNSKG